MLNITDPAGCPEKNGSIQFKSTDTLLPTSYPHTVDVRIMGEGVPTTCKTIFSGVPKTSSNFVSASWDTTQMSDGIYWVGIKINYQPSPSYVEAYARFTINNGYSGQLCQPPDRPTVDIQANDSNGPITIAYNTSAFIKWTSTNASGCTVLPTSWTGKSGGQSTGNLQSSKTYTVNCFGPGGNNDDSVTVNVSPETGSPPESPPGNPSSPSLPSGSSSNGSNNNATTKTTTSTGETIISPETVTTQTLASSEKLVIEEDIPVSISEFDPDVFLKGSSIKLTTIKNVKQGEKNLIRFEGRTKPNTLVTLYIFSNPIIVTLKSDSKGNWNYEREKRIETGKHSVFATIYDEGVTRRSDVTNFFVAKNSTGNLILKNTGLSSLYNYALIIGIVLAVSVVILIMYRIYLSKRAQKQWQHQS